MLRHSDRVASKFNPQKRRKTPHIASTAVVEDPPKKRQKKDSMLGLCARRGCLEVEEAETIVVVIGRWECKTDAGWQPFEKPITQAFERALSHGVNVLPFVRKEIKYVAELQTMIQRRNDGKFTTARAIRRCEERHLIPVYQVRPFLTLCHIHPSHTSHTSIPPTLARLHNDYSSHSFATPILPITLTPHLPSAPSTPTRPRTQQHAHTKASSKIAAPPALRGLPPPPPARANPPTTPCTKSSDRTSKSRPCGRSTSVLEMRRNSPSHLSTFCGYSGPNPPCRWVQGPCATRSLRWT